MNQVLSSETFRLKLKEVGTYIARESGSRETAVKFLNRIHEKCKLYARQPEMGELRVELGEGIRCFPVKSYILFYRPVEKGIFLVAIIHGARDIPAVFRKMFKSE